MYVTPSTPSTLTNPTIERVINLSIDVGNSFNFEDRDKFNFSRLVNLSIDVGNSSTASILTNSTIEGQSICQ